jgi:hypothetical protein
MKKLFFSLIFLTSFAKISNGQQVFTSSDAYNDYMFKNTYLPFYTTGFLLDKEEEWNSNEIDSVVNKYNSSNFTTDDMIAYLQMLERTDVTKKFEKDNILFQKMDYFYSISLGEEVKIPLFVLDYDFSRISKQKREEIEKTELPYPKLKTADFSKLNLFCSAFFMEELVLNDNTKFYWDESTYKTNTKKIIKSITLSTNTGTIEIKSGELVDLRKIIKSNSKDAIISLSILYSDGSKKTSSFILNLSNLEQSKSGEKKYTALDEYLFWNKSGEFGNDPKIKYHIKYGCGHSSILKPYIMVAGFGPYTGEWLINLAQGWPTGSLEMYDNMNVEGLCDDLLAAGYDIVLAQFAPPNADIRNNADRLEELINLLNTLKYSNGSYEENIVHGVSAGALCLKLTLQRMEKKHLESNGPHPHTKLFVSFDGENQGANIPLGNQHSVWYLDEYHTGIKVYALHYILNADLSKQLLKYFYTQTGNQASPGQGHHPMRDYYLWEHSYANHSKNTHLIGYPSFNRNISITNGSSTPNITNENSNNFPYPKTEEYTIFAQNNRNRSWRVNLNGSGKTTVFSYEHFKPIVGLRAYHFVTDEKCLVLDNSPGGSVIGANPLMSTMEEMDSKISGKADVYRPNTLFSFTPTIFTLDIRNYDAIKSKYRLDYNLKTNKLMYQHKDDVNNPQGNQSDIYGYPHLAYPYSHYWQITPFDAVFAWSQNTEHLTFSIASKTYGDITNEKEPWRAYYPSYMGDIFKKFVLEEADYQQAFIQNKQYGWNARNNYIYITEIKAPKTISAGKEVTQRTDFKVVEVLKNANVTFQAGESISLKSGFQVLAGGVFHAVIQRFNCNSLKMMTITTNHSSIQEAGDSKAEVELQAFEKSENIMVYPNPATGEITIQLPKNIDISVEKGTYFIYDLQGQLHRTGTLEQTPIQLSIKEGIYLVKVKHNQNEYTEKLIVR